MYREQQRVLGLLISSRLLVCGCVCTCVCAFGKVFGAHFNIVIIIIIEMKQSLLWLYPLARPEAWPNCFNLVGFFFRYLWVLCATFSLCCTTCWVIFVVVFMYPFFLCYATLCVSFGPKSVLASVYLYKRLWTICGRRESGALRTMCVCVRAHVVVGCGCHQVGGLHAQPAFTFLDGNCRRPMAGKAVYAVACYHLWLTHLRISCFYLFCYCCCCLCY